MIREEIERSGLRKWWASLALDEQERVMVDAVEALIEDEQVNLNQEFYEYGGYDLYVPYWVANGDKVGEFL